MAESCVLYYITNRRAFSGDEHSRCSRLLNKIAEAAGAGVDYIQLREKDLSARELELLAREVVNVIRSANIDTRKRKTALLINSRTDVALATAAQGVHLPWDDVSPLEVRAAWKVRSGGLAPLVAVSCHSAEEVAEAAANQATFAVFAPVFEKKDAPGNHPTGIDALRAACRGKVPVLALGGVTLENARLCLGAGAAGIAAIRLFQENDIASVVRELRD
jgi:thiamine-phosphate pyrophosphorylase